MFYDVRIFDSNKVLKKVISSEELEKRHWEMFFKNEKLMSFNSIAMDNPDPKIAEHSLG